MGTLILMAAWFGIVAGLVEGVGLLLFQRINWARWGAMLHVSEQIVWIAVVVDLLFFCFLVVVIGTAARLLPRLPATRITVFVLSAAAVYDWLTVTGRLYHLSSLLLALGVAAVITRWIGKREAAALQFWRRTLPWMVAVAVVAAIGIQSGRWWTEQRALAKLPSASLGSPNVLVIVVDTLRADHLSSYHYARPTSPNIDRIAAQGVLFENAFSTSSWSFPSHVSLVTGAYQFEHGMGTIPPVGIFDSGGPSFNRYPTLGEALERRGYRTAAFSANRTYFTHDLGFSRGFTHFEDYFHSAADMLVRTLYGKEFARIYLTRSNKSKPKRLLRFLGFDSLLDVDDEGSVQMGGAQGVRKRATAVNQELLRWVDEGKPARPFFAFLNYYDVHHPYGGPASFHGPAWAQETVVEQYDDGVRYVDGAIGQLMVELERRGLGRNTLVVITSDHGESLGQHGIAYHGETLYLEQIHVPLVFWYPGRIPAGVQVATTVTNASIPATLMEVLDPSGPSRFPAPALTPLWTHPQEKQPWPDIMAEVAQIDPTAKEDLAAEKIVPTSMVGPMKSLLGGQWHLIVHKSLGDQLYDWIDDPGESTNLIASSAGQEAAGKLSSQMRDLLTQSLPSVAAGLRLSAVSLHDGVPITPAGQARTSSRKQVCDYYRVEADAGSIVTVEVSTRKPAPANAFDPVVEIEGAGGELLQSCRNPGDDPVSPPGTSDPTPEAFDDMCINDDIRPGAGKDSRLELLVPGKTGSRVELYVRVSDWDGRDRPDPSYQIRVTGMKEPPAIKALAR
ncbi:MAG: sulfatase [Acidobacteriia bacterium]|nr:sulfatase [Terriglobia bacterium]